VKFFYSPNACSIGIHVLLEEIGKPYERAWVNFGEAAQYKPDYVAINPKSKVPAIARDDGSILTEFPAIAYYLARANPESGLLPADLEGEIRGLELLEYMTATIHMRGYTRIFRPGNFAPGKEDEPKVIEAGRGFVTKGFELLEPILGGKPYMLGEHLTFADSGLFFITYWAKNRAEIPMPDNLDAYLSRMLARPAVQRVLAAEGLA
jgi:glutathione S-transferase